MKICAVIITAYEAENYILDCLESLKKQKLPKGWICEFYIGVDACKKTEQVLKQHLINFYLAKENVGTYVLSNSLLREAQINNARLFVRFDSDDIAGEKFLYKGIKHADRTGFCRPNQIACDENMNPISNKISPAHGSMFVRRDALEQLGGYYHYRVGCDTNFYRRAERLGFGTSTNNDYDIPFYYYRTHKTSLMKHSTMGKGTIYRRESWEQMKKEYFAGVNKIENIVTTPLFFEKKELYDTKNYSSNMDRR